MREACAVLLVGYVTLALAFQQVPTFAPVGLRSATSPAQVPLAAWRTMSSTSKKVVSPRMVFGLDADQSADKATPAFSSHGMTVKEFFEMSVGNWKCLRTSHNIAFGMVEEVNTDMVVQDIPRDDPEIIEMCKAHKVDAKDIILGSKVTWEGYSDWDDKEINGTTTFGLIADEPSKGRLLRSQGYAETIPAVSQWEMTPRGEFILVSVYEALAAEEMMVFKTKDLRMRFSSIKTQGGKGVTTASLSTEVRQV